MFGSLTVPTLALIDSNGGMDKNIIYAVLHEAIYCQGQETPLFIFTCSFNNKCNSKPSLWSADRHRFRNPKFQVDQTRPQPEIYFTGEMVSEPPFESMAY